MYSNGLLLLYRRGIRPKDSTSSLDGGDSGASPSAASALWQYNRAEGHPFGWSRAGIFFNWPWKVSAEKGLNLYRAYTLWCNATQRTGVRRPLFWNDSPEDCSLYAVCQRGTLEDGRTSQDTAQWGGSCTAWAGSYLCRGQCSCGPQPDYDADIKESGESARACMSAAWEAFCWCKWFWKTQ